MSTGSYWREQKISDYLISGWDGLGLSMTQHLQANEGQAVVEADLSPKYRSQLKLDLLKVKAFMVPTGSYRREIEPRSRMSAIRSRE